MSNKMTLKTSLKMSPPDFSVLPSLAAPSQDILSDPSRLFLYLTQWTVPHGGEEQYYGKMLDALGFNRDEHGNWWIEILHDNGDYPDTCFTCHLDTADWAPKQVSRMRDLKDRVFTDGNSILGADDRAGLTVVLSMVYRDVPGLYYLFVGEECGCVGSGRVSRANHMPDLIKKIVSFDRKGTDSIITHQGGSRTCSDVFATELAIQFSKYGMDMEPDPDGVFTDSKEFADDFPECTNISVGYEKAHTSNEYQDLKHLALLVFAAANIDWKGLPVDRDPSVIDESDWQTYGKRYYGYSYGDDDYRDTFDYSDYSLSKSQKQWEQEVYDDAIDAIDQLVEDFGQGKAPDLNLISYLTRGDTSDTIDYISLLLSELQREAWDKGDNDD